MKRLLACLLVLAIAFGMCACAGKDDEIQKPVNFYYLGLLDAKDDFENIVIAEVREGYGYEDSTLALINLYLFGPKSEEFTNPFPEDVTVHSLSVESEKVSIVLTKQFAQLTGLDLTLACSCLCLTLLELYDADTVQIAAAGALLAGRDTLTFDKNDLVLTDISYSSSVQ